MARKIIVAIALVALVLSMAWVRVAIDGHRARGQGDELLDAGRADEAVGYYDRALHMYWPGSPDVAHAVARLAELAAERETGDDLDGAVHVWRVLRSGLYAARGLYQPYPEVIGHAEQRLAILVARQAENPLAAEAHLKKLQESKDPHKSEIDGECDLIARTRPAECFTGKQSGDV